jgi:integrative and conjugative element protein (TIGR02256 family)
MQLLLPSQLIRRLERELRRAGSREIGGLLMGEHVRDALFRIVDISVQRSGGSHACFIRHPKDHEKQLKKFFARTGSDYTRFNYLGEWHSHPGFDPVPSATDVETMQSIVDDPNVGVNFLVLLVCRRATGGAIEATAVAFRAATEPLGVPVALEAPTQAQTTTLTQRFWRFLGL